MARRGNYVWRKDLIDVGREERKSVRNCGFKLGVMGLTGAENNVYLNGKKVLKGLKMDNSNFYIFTGGPGSGKSTVLNILSVLGYLTVREVGRDIIFLFYLSVLLFRFTTFYAR